MNLPLKEFQVFYICLLFLLSKPAFGLKPQLKYNFTPDSLGLSYETIKIFTTDSFRINAWKMLPSPVDNNSKTVIIAGSDAGNMSQYCFHAYSLVMKGYTVITFDYRGFGASDSFDINENFLYYNEFAKDLEAVIQWSRESLGNRQTGVWAFSMGSIITVLAYENQKLDFIVFEGLVLNPLVVSIRLKLLKGKNFYNPEGAERIEQLYQNITCKMLLFSGRLDQISTPADSKKISQTNKNRKLIQYEGDHLQGLEILSRQSFGDQYFKILFKFLNRKS